MRQARKGLESSNLSPSAFARLSGLRRTKSARRLQRWVSLVTDCTIMYYVYTLRCSDGQLYTGCTADLKERILRHTNGQVPATATRLPIQLITYTALADKYKAFELEIYQKSGSGRAFMKKHLL